MWHGDKKNRPSPTPVAVPDMANPDLHPGVEASVRQLIANGKAKAALENAKAIYKARPTPATEAMLVDAYAARIQSLFDQKLELEANALLDLVLERYPSARERLSGLKGIAGAHTGQLDELVRPLADPELNAERRASIEAAVAREVMDPAALAGCAALPPEHPLRRAASALHAAFAAVTAGPISDEVIALPEVSHRSPLASWKLLIRAIAAFYRADDEVARRSLEAIQPDSAPARLVPAMEAMLGGKPAQLTRAAAALVSATSFDPAVMKKPLEALDRAFGLHQNGTILRCIREAVKACRENAPDQIERLKQHISVRCALEEINVDKVQAALGGPSRHDAYFCRLFARGLEQHGDPEHIALACAMWDEFRKEAVQSGWFAASGPEAATLYLHMAGVLQRLPRELQDALQSASRRAKYSEEEQYYLYPEKLYERACVLDPHPEAFSQWMNWARRGKRGRAERVAEAWHKVRPNDIEPILILMTEKEKRNAYHTALQLLAKAERIDAVNPAVRQARLRLLAGGALRHIQQERPHLAEEKLAELESLRQSQQGDRPAFLAGLRHLIAKARGSDGAADRAQMERLLGGGRVAAELVLAALARATKQEGYLTWVERLDKKERARLPEALVRAADLTKDLGLDLAITHGWLAETAKQFPQSGQSLQVKQLRTLAEVALGLGESELAFAVAGAGLQRGGPTEARFLLARAQALPQTTNERWVVCAAAAAQLARQQRQMDVVDQAIELLAESSFNDLTLTSEQASTVLKTEKAEHAFPTPFRRGPDYSDMLSDYFCDCPKCRRARGESVGPFDDLDEDYFNDNEEDDEDLESTLDQIPILPDMPPEIAKIIVRETTKAVKCGESLDSVMNRLLGAGAVGSRKKGRR